MDVFSWGCCMTAAGTCTQTSGAEMRMLTAWDKKTQMYSITVTEHYFCGISNLQVKTYLQWLHQEKKPLAMNKSSKRFSAMVSIVLKCFFVVSLKVYISVCLQYKA